MGNPSDFDPTAPYIPTTLTDQRAGYSVPSEAALAFAEKVQKACLLDVNLHDLLQHDVARLLDAFAAQAVAAREAEIVATVDEWRKPAIFGAEEARRKNRYDLKREFDLVAQAYDKVIEIIRKL